MWTEKDTEIHEEANGCFWHFCEHVQGGEKNFQADREEI